MANQSIVSLDFLNTVFSSYLGNLITAVIILLIGFIIGRVVGKLTTKVLHEFELDTIVKKAAPVKVSLEKAIGSVAAYLIYFATVIIALDQLGLTTVMLYIISSAIILLILASFLLGIKDFIPNIIAGIFILRKRFLQEGDKIKIKDMQGKIEDIGLVETKIITKKGDTLFIPNSQLMKHEVIKLKK